MRSIVVHAKFLLKEEQYVPNHIEFNDGCGSMEVTQDMLHPKLQQCIDETMAEYSLDIFNKGVDAIPMERELTIRRI